MTGEPRRGAGEPRDGFADEVEGETVVVDRGAARGARFDDEQVDATIVVVREASATPGEGDSPVVDATVVVERERAGRRAAIEDATVVVRRGRPSADGPADSASADTILGEPDAPDMIFGESDAEADTILGGGSPDEADATVVVDRGDASRGIDPSIPRWDSSSGEQSGGFSGSSGSSSGRFGSSSGSGSSSGLRSSSGSGRVGVTDSPTPRRRFGGRRTLQPAPLEPIDLRRSVRAAGAGAIEYYRPRELPRATTAPLVETDPTPPREPKALPSVERRARRVAATSLVAFVAAIGVGLAGAVTVVGMLLRP